MLSAELQPYPVIALIGRTNVGKSTLFNRLTESHNALVSEIAGTTRDRLSGTILWRGKGFTLVDTGGFDVEGGVIEKASVWQARIAAEHADLIFFVVDGEVGPLPDDRVIAHALRGKPVILVVNKCEKERNRQPEVLQSFRALGVGEPMTISSANGMGTGDLLDAAKRALWRMGKRSHNFKVAEPVRVIFLGRPNVGKSSLVNAILGEERQIVSPIANTTREPEDISIEWKGREVTLVDTAGLRRISRVSDALTSAGMKRTLEAIRRADICFFVIDVSEPLQKEDLRIAGLIKDAKKGCVLVANKWDLIPNKVSGSAPEFERALKAQLPFFGFAPIVFVSAVERQRTAEILDLALAVEKSRTIIIPEDDLMKFFREMIAKHRPSRGKGVRHPYLFRLRQIGARPPRFLLTVKGRRDSVHFSYLRYLENQLREKFGFKGTPLDIVLEDVSL